MQLRDNKWFMLCAAIGGPVPTASGQFKHTRSAASSWNTPGKTWSEEEKEKEVTDTLRQSYSLLYVFLPRWNEESFSVWNTRQLSGQLLHDRQLLISRFLKASLALAALPRPIWHRWAASHQPSGGTQNVSFFCSAHTRRDCFSRAVFKISW